MEKFKQFILSNKYNVFLILFYFIVTLFTFLHHELWRDEAQVWCLLRDLNFFESMNASRVEGHPFLWYLLIFPFAKLNFHVSLIQILSWFFVFASVVYFVLKSPFNNLFKTIFIFSAGMLYYLPIIARNYALIPIFLFMLAYLYKDRAVKPFKYTIVLILLSQTHILMMGFCAIVFVIFGIEKLQECIKNKAFRPIMPVVILGLYFLIMLILFYTVPYENYIVENYSHRNITLSQTIFSFVFHYLNLNFYLPVFTLLFIAFFFVIIFRLFILDKKLMIIFTGSFIYIIAVLNKLWFGGIPYQKIYTVLLILVFCLWILKNENKLINEKLLKTVVYIIFCIGLFTSCRDISADIKYNFSGGKQLSQYIKNNLNSEDTFILIGLPYTFTTISAYMPDKKLFLYQTNTYLTFYDFNKNTKIQQQKFPENAKYYIVQNDFAIVEDSGFKKVFSTDKENLSGIAEQEVFTIYEKI